MTALIAVMVSGVLLGTMLGERLLLGLSQERFRVLVSAAIAVLGVWFMLRPGG